MTEKKRPQDVTSVERDIRVRVVLQWILDGTDRQTVIRDCNKRWGVGHQAADFYTRDARVQIKEEFNLNRDGRLELHSRRLEALLKKNIKKGDFKEARLCLESERKLTGLDAPVKKHIEGDIHVEANIKGYVTITPDDWDTSDDNTE